MEAPSGALGDPWLDQLPGVVAGAFLRKYIAQRFVSTLGGEVHKYSEHNGLSLHFLPQQDQSSKRGCMVFLHGGGFLGGAPSQFYPYAKEISRRFGISTACCEVSCFLTHPFSKAPFDSIDDAQRCVRYLQENADDMGIDREKIVLAGASSGGHTATMAALRENLGLAGLVLFNPVLDLEFARRFGERQLEARLGSWALRCCYGEGRLRANSPLHSTRQLSQPTLILHGTADHLVPIEEVEGFQRGMETTGSDCKLVTFPGEGHFFFNWRVSPVNFAHCVGLVGDFLKGVGVLHG
ncbi:IMCEL1 [Symbiodinium natans]|uniref:IMCEL1 protein n=1 Tax=Symbiodinium natans TaxID=878477 RepID=A0A812GL88_9DINO|nr:IMCEL1 [Symbiodinium natans]